MATPINELQQLRDENQKLQKEVEFLRSEMVRLIGHNMDITEKLEDYTGLRLRARIAKELLDGNIERQRNADLQDDAQLLALIDLRVENNRDGFDPSFNSTDLARLLGVSQERLARLFRRFPLYRSVDAYLDNLRLLKALHLLYKRPQYSIAAVAEEAGFGNVRTLQRRMQDVMGMTPVEYRRMLTRDIK